jgi:predicted TIM-barrel fold metal-dependent hydrolase
MGVDENDATDIKALKLDALDNSKIYCKGIKIASHRGWWNRDGEIDSGFDYGKESSKLHKWLKQLPDNSIVSMHMQGDPINNSASVPMTVGMYAYKYPKLKFIMNHMGDYGQGGLSNKPKSYVTQTKDGPNLFPAFRYAHSRALCKSAVEFANIQHNIILDTSVYIPNKSEMLKDCYRWAVGSDYPFCKSDNLFINEEKKFIRDMGEDAVNEAHVNAKWFFDSDYKQLIKKNIALNNFGDLNATTPKRVTQKA